MTPLLDEAPRSAGLKVLIADFDFYAGVGGGQSVYRSIIQANPQNTYYYLLENESPEAVRPSNAIPVRFSKLYKLGGPKLYAKGAYALPYIQACNIAASVARALGSFDFDVVDSPDYRHTALFLRHALEQRGIGVGTVALALHGRIASALRSGWPNKKPSGRRMATLRRLDSLQFRAVDSRYALSQAYASELQRHTPMPINLIDPVCIVGASEPVLAAGNEHPDLVFVGRREKRKGPDLFLDLGWWVGSDNFRRLVLVGPDVVQRGEGSNGPLETIARHRQIPFSIVEEMSRRELDELFRRRTLVVLPSRYDQFNLVALEALRVGCPVLVSCHAGIAEWLRERYPTLPWLVIDTDCSRTAGAAARAILNDYDRYRDAVVEALKVAPLIPDSASFDTMYAEGNSQDEVAAEFLREIAVHFDLNAPPRDAKGGAVRRRSRKISQRLLRTLRAPTSERFRLPDMIARLLRPTRTNFAAPDDNGQKARSRPSLKRSLNQALQLNEQSIRQLRSVTRLPSLRRRIVKWPELTSSELEAKLTELSTQGQALFVDRVRLYRELGRLERRRSNDLIAATYCLRVMRWLGQDCYGDLPFVLRTLNTHGYPGEAKVAEAMFKDSAHASTRLLSLMQEQFARHRSKGDLPLEFIDDRRGGGSFRCAVVVSLYAAETKLSTFLQMIEQQTIAAHGELEVILVDSGSPTNEHRVFLDHAERSSLPILYARSHQRETIQAAWNRGIRLSTAPYLAFLGVDEGIHPECLSILAKVLDENDGVDWAMSDSIVTNVDRRGTFDNDIMIYDRRGYRQDLVYLETCYLSWVGGLYRRDIHDRFGYYDETFRAAGDTEFKCRVMPFIESRHVPCPLGVFNNYPEERTTQHPRAEIEDLRAWYLWRTEAGMEYAFASKPADRLWQLFKDCLNYRKSYCGHVSTDFDLALSLARHLASRPDASALSATAVAEAQRMLDLFRHIELTNTTIGKWNLTISKWRLQLLLADRLLTAKRAARQHQKLFDLEHLPHYEIFNDNRYEQHWWSWST